ncbi:u3 small nucleolar RNA-associated protein 11 [Fistulina hepatica ATCC 64428]|uniref:U3 small nucleolar RNA-associated protein 11 n=1 Tax=Fistulina hepatica ATCC 64428 TaxID=1128425 RepID=A0A0D7AKF1_9AGAR|nr:u3 small nucleolar RNA-associated protein 11 [Fistulina hepatica ATCC 64428]
MVSSARKTVHRRNHKERSQLAHRAKLGLLEKHKDYVKRAQDYHSKQDRLNRLRQKAAEKNKDEFYFSMTREKTKGGVHVKERGNVALPTDMVKILKTQDENYIRTMRSSGQKKIDKLKDQLSVLANLLTVDETDGLSQNELEVLREAAILPSHAGKGTESRQSKHLVFADTEEQGQARSLFQSTRLLMRHSSDTPGPSEVGVDESVATDLGWKQTAPSQKKDAHTQDANGDFADENGDDFAVDVSSDSSDRGRLLKELAARLVRDRQLRNVLREFEMQRLMMGKGSRKRVKAAERVEASDAEDSSDEDALDARGGKPLKSKLRQHEENYRPRIYKWKLERR